MITAFKIAQISRTIFTPADEVIEVTKLINLGNIILHGNASIIPKMGIVAVFTATNGFPMIAKEVIRKQMMAITVAFEREFFIGYDSIAKVLSLIVSFIK